MRRPHDVPLSRQAIAVLKEIWSLNEEHELVFSFVFVVKTVRDRRPFTLPFVLAKVALGGFHQRFLRCLVIAPENLFHAAAIAEEASMRGELDLASLFVFGVVEDHPVSDTAVVASVERGNAPFLLRFDSGQGTRSFSLSST
jgi:hypothetical protein